MAGVYNAPTLSARLNSVFTRPGKAEDKTRFPERIRRADYLFRITANRKAAMPKLTERSERLLLQALKESRIEEANETNQLPPLLGGTTVVYWRRTGNDDLEIVNESRSKQLSYLAATIPGCL
jgi:hypothetical protein